jgi:hypothetical protein
LLWLPDVFSVKSIVVDRKFRRNQPCPEAADVFVAPPDIVEQHRWKCRDVEFGEVSAAANAEDYGTKLR